jgi:hypothetical protein
MSKFPSGSRLNSEFAGMLDDEMKFLREDTGMSVTNAPAMVSRYLRGGMVEQSLTPETKGKIDSEGSVFRRVISPVQDFRSCFATANGVPSSISVGNSDEIDSHVDGVGQRETIEVKDDSRDELMARLSSAGDIVRRGLKKADEGDGYGVAQPIYFPGDFRFLSSFRSQTLMNEMETSSSFEQAQILSQHRPDPSLRINSGPLPFGQGEGVNRERRVPNNGDIPPLVAGSTSVRGNSGERSGRKIFRIVFTKYGNHFP